MDVLHELYRYYGRNIIVCLDSRRFFLQFDSIYLFAIPKKPKFSRNTSVIGRVILFVLVCFLAEIDFIRIRRTRFDFPRVKPKQSVHYDDDVFDARTTKRNVALKTIIKTHLQKNARKFIRSRTSILAVECGKSQVLFEI